MNKKDLLTCGFAGWNFQGFVFPRAGELDGCIGTNCISKAQKLYLRGKHPVRGWNVEIDKVTGLLSAHLNFIANSEMIKKTSKKLVVTLTKFHMTVRPTLTQNTINAAGPSILTAKDSIHIGNGTAWGREDNIKSLLDNLNLRRTEPDLSVEDLILFLTEFKGYTTQALAGMAEDLQRKAQIHLTDVFQIPVTVVGGDKTFPK